MRYILMIGINDLAQYYIDVIQTYSNMKIIAIIDTQKTAFHSSDVNSIPITHELDPYYEQHIDYIFNCSEETFKNKEKNFISTPMWFTANQLNMIQPFINNFTQQFENLELILNNIRDGLIVVDEYSTIQFMNQTAKDILDIPLHENKQVPIKDIIVDSRLPKVLQHQEREVNQRFVLNNKKIITTRIPLINEKNHLIGAFAIFKDSDEIQKLAEENTDLKEIKTMLEAIIHSSDEAISVVDENGNGLIINPAYTRITGLSEKDVIGKPATVDIYEGESMHLKVLKSRRPVRGAKMKVGPQKKEVIVNVAPIIVQGKLKGSVAVIHDISEIKELTTALKQAKQMIRNLEATYTFGDIIGDSSEMMIAIEQAKIGAKTPATVLLRGASGTGKELFAHAIHNESERKYHKFIRVNCAAIAESIVESELFGYEDGAFTGARAGGKKGLFEEANKGSIFLDEIGELSLNMQIKLLRVLQEKEVVRVGGTIPIPLDIRVITATNLNLEKAITSKKFREDLYYRLSRLPIHIPALKDRISDLPELVEHIIMKVNQLYGRNISGISDTALEKLRLYHWPGNIRELENVISRAVIFMDVTDEKIHSHHLPNLQPKTEQNMDVVSRTDQNLQHATENFEKMFIEKVYKENKYNKTLTAKKLGISVRNLYYKLEKLNIQ